MKQKASKIDLLNDVFASFVSVSQDELRDSMTELKVFNFINDIYPRNRRRIPIVKGNDNYIKLQNRLLELVSSSEYQDNLIIKFLNDRLKYDNQNLVQVKKYIK